MKKRAVHLEYSLLANQGRINENQKEHFESIAESMGIDKAVEIYSAFPAKDTKEISKQTADDKFSLLVAQGRLGKHDRDDYDKNVEKYGLQAAVEIYSQRQPVFYTQPIISQEQQSDNGLKGNPEKIKEYRQECELFYPGYSKEEQNEYIQLCLQYDLDNQPTNNQVS